MEGCFGQRREAALTGLGKKETAVHALIIEDEFMIATVIEYVLRDCGFDSFDIAVSSEAAIAAAARRGVPRPRSGKRSPTIRCSTSRSPNKP